MQEPASIGLAWLTPQQTGIKHDWAVHLKTWLLQTLPDNTCAGTRERLTQRVAPSEQACHQFNSFLLRALQLTTNRWLFLWHHLRLPFIPASPGDILLSLFIPSQSYSSHIRESSYIIILKCQNKAYTVFFMTFDFPKWFSCNMSTYWRDALKLEYIPYYFFLLLMHSLDW